MFESVGANSTCQGGTWLARVGTALARVHHFKNLRNSRKKKVVQLRRENQSKGSATPQLNMSNYINSFLFDCVVSEKGFEKGRGVSDLVYGYAGIAYFAILVF